MIGKKIIFKKLTRPDFHIYMKWYHQYSEASYFRLASLGGMSEVDLQVCVSYPDLEIFIYENDAVRGFVTLSSINKLEHNAYCYLFLEPGRPDDLQTLQLFLLGFCRNNSIYKLQSLILTDDDMSRQLLEGLGFVEEGCLKQQHFMEGRFHDLYIYGQFYVVN